MLYFFPDICWMIVSDVFIIYLACIVITTMQMRDFISLNPASLLYLSQRAGSVSYGFHNAVLHSSSWHKLTA